MDEAERRALRERVGSIMDVLLRHGLWARYLTCPNPAHDDRRPGSVKILPATVRGPERIFCHSCGFHEDSIGLARLLGEQVDFPKRRSESFIWRHRPKRLKEAARETRIRRELEDDATIQVDWITAKKLAELGNRRAVQKEILRNWEYLSERCNIPRVWKLVNAIWEQGTEEFGLPSELSPRGWRDWVARVCDG